MEKLLNKPSIVKCSHCKKILSSNDFQTHECIIELKGTQTIPVVDFIDSSCKGKIIITATGIDGVLYAFESIPRKAIPITRPLTDERLQGDETDEDFTDPI